MAALALDTSQMETLSSSVHSRIVREGWSQDDDTALAEYIVLMLANGKSQTQVAAELAGELLQDAQGTEEFSKWLFEQVAQVSGGGNSASAQDMSGDVSMPSGEPDAIPTEPAIPAAYEPDMVEAAPDNAYVSSNTKLCTSANACDSPKGPRGSLNSRGGRGGRGSIPSKPADSVLHRTRGNDRINSHNVRGAPKGPRNLQNRSSMQKALNGLANAPTGPQGNMMQNGMPNPQGGNMQFSQEQQLQYLAMMEQQAQLMAQWNQIQQGMNGSPQGRSLFDRVESGRGRGGMRGRGRGGPHQNGANGRASVTGEPKADGEASADGDASMEGMEQHHKSKSTTPLCRWNLTCTNKECPFAHQSPAAPMNIPVDLTQTCEYGVTCKNVSCTATHPSPALKQAHQAESECKFWPNCTKPNCPFKHPTAKMCTFGASCKNVNCKFTHLQTKCRFNPCTNARCPYLHEAGQNRSMADYTWTPESAKQKEEQKQQQDEHLSDRKFVADAMEEEELIKPEAGEAAQREEVKAAEVDETIT